MNAKIVRIIECLKKYNPEKIIIFGSHARKEDDEFSDVDFVIIKKTEKRFIERLIEVAKLIDNDLGKVDVFVYTLDEFKMMIETRNTFMENVLRDGKVIYETK